MMRALLATLCVAIASGADHGFLIEKQPLKADGSAICDTVKQYAGYYKLTTGDKSYFYWFFESRSAPATDPVVLWMTGGPGCSSEVALFGENGPCKVNSAGDNTTSNPFSWNSNANLVYIDQPAGTGFSFGSGKDHDEVGVANDMYDFLQQFFKAHAELQKLDFFAVGESYAGHYVPAVTHKIWQNNQNLTDGAIKINLKGTSVGNGLTDPSIQYDYYKDMIISTNHHEAAVGSVVHDAMKVATPACLAAIAGCNKGVPATCLGATELCNAALMLPYTATGMNPYDMRIKCAKEPLCYDFSNVGTYLERAEVQAALGINKDHAKWVDCNHAVAIEFELGGDWMHDYQQMIPDQLAAGIRVLIYAGDQDYICNWLGNQAWAQQLTWPHHDAFANATIGNWTAPGATDGGAIGTLQSSNGFSFLRVYDAGHMVPRDQPANALAMLNAFIHDKIPMMNEVPTVAEM